MINECDKHKLGFLIWELVEGSITDEHLDKLNQWLDQSPEALSFYRNFFKTSITLKNNFRGYALDEDNRFAQSQLWEVLALEERTAPTVEIVHQTLQEQPRRIVKIKKEPLIVSKFTFYSAVAIIAASLLLFLMIELKPVLPPVALLTDSINAEWGELKKSPVNGNGLRQGKFMLTKGLAEITFDDGAVVVIESPAVFELESVKSMYLESGKVSAYVARCATGFTVNTPNVTIVDLGTEFGVDVEYDGTCDLQMFAGMANLIIGREGQEKTSQLINVKEAKNVNGQTGRVRDIALQENHFVRRIDSARGLVWKGQDFDLADVVGNGNGFGSGDHTLVLDPIKGTFTRDYPEWTFIQESGSYVSVLNTLFIDGVFIPDGETEHVVISSSGYHFKGCPDTSNIDRTYGFIRTGGTIATNQVPNDHRRLILDGITYGGKDHSVIFMHANVGITFDLDAVRRSLPQGSVIKEFAAICGVSDDAPAGPEAGKSDFRVLVDGQTKFEHLGVTKNNLGQSVRVLIGPEDRFLTLVTTDGGDTTYNDYCLFARPVLVLE